MLRLARRSDTFEQCSGGYNDGGPCNSAADCPSACVNDPTRRCAADSDCVSGACGPAGTCGPTVCDSASTHPGRLCNTDASCAGGECGPETFPLAAARASADSGVGAVELARFGPFTPFLDPGVCQEATDAMCTASSDCSGGSTGPCVRYAIEAESPVPLEGLTSTDQVFTFTANEAITGQILDGDLDAQDLVLTLRNRVTGQSIPIGRSGSVGRTVNAVHVSPFSFPGLAAEGNVAAILEPEATYNSNAMDPQAGTDRNGDGDTDDTMVHVFKVDTSGTTATDVMGSQELAVDAGLLINGRSLAVSDGQVFFRVPEQGPVAQTTFRASQAPGGPEPDGFSIMDSTIAPTISADGRFVTFRSTATNLIPGISGSQVYVYDRDADGNGVFDEAGGTAIELVSQTTGGVGGNGSSAEASISATGRYVVFFTQAPNLVPGQYSPCQADSIGLINPPSGACPGLVLRDRVLHTTELVSLDASGSGGPNGDAEFPTVSADGRFIAFWSVASNLLPMGQDTNTCGAWTTPGTCADIFVYDRCVADGVSVCANPHTERVSLRSGGVQTQNRSDLPQITPDGRFVLFTSRDDLVGKNSSGHDTAYLVDRTTGEPELVTASPTTGFAFDTLGDPAFMSADARYIAFTTTAPLVPGAGFSGYVRDRLTGAYDIVTVASDGTANNGVDGAEGISPDGRYVLTSGYSTNLVADDTNGASDLFVHDRVTGATRRVNVPAGGGNADAGTGFGGMSADGRTVAFPSGATNLLGAGNDNNGVADIFIRTVDWSSPDTKDLTGDHDLDDTILEVLDSGATPGTPPTPLCPADAAATANGMVAFLRPESAGDTTLAKLPRCPRAASFVGGKPDLNGDGDASDEVVHLWRGGANNVDNLKCAANSVALSSNFVAAAVTETTIPQLKTLALSNVPPASCTAWTATNQEAESIAFCGDIVAFLTSESAQGANLNAGTGDTDQNDRVLQLFNPATGALINTGHATVDFVCNDRQVAFRVREANDGPGFPGNGDADTLDDVMLVYDLTRPGCVTSRAPADCTINTGQAVRPCLFEVCDPQLPYRVLTDQVKFLTYEGDQSQDLNHDGDQGDLILQIYDVRKNTLTFGGTVGNNCSTPTCEGTQTGGNPVDPPTTSGSVVTNPTKRCQIFLGAPASCSTDLDCQPPNSGGVAGAFCQGTRCWQLASLPSTCTADSDCPSGAFCRDDQVAATQVQPPAHDSVILPRKALTVKIPAGTTLLDSSFTVKVLNADVLPAPEAPGHAIRLAAEDGDCPQDTVGVPDLGGGQDHVVVAGGKQAKAVVPLHLDATKFTTHNGAAPHRCTLLLKASTVLQGNVDPNPSNDVFPLELNVIDGNDTPSVTTHESLVVSAKPIKLGIGSAQTKQKTVKVTVVNADGGESAGHDITVTATDQGNCSSLPLGCPSFPLCPAHTVGTVAPATVTVAGGAKGSVAVPITVGSSDFTTTNKHTPSRCAVVLTATTAVMGNTEPDASNNTTYLVIDVVDKADF